MFSFPYFVDNVTLKLDGVLYVKVEDPYKASYGVEDPEYAITQLAQTSTRSELGKLQLDQVFEERQKLNLAIVDAINEASVEPWGIRCMRYEIRSVEMVTRRSGVRVRLRSQLEGPCFI